MKTGLEGAVGDREKLLIWGASGHAAVISEAVSLCGRLEILGFVVEDEFYHLNHSVSPVYSSTQCRELSLASDCRVFVAIGDCDTRMRVGIDLRRRGYRLTTIFHPGAIVSASARIGEGVFVGAGAIVNPNSHVGDLALVNSGAIVEHDCSIGVGAHIGPGACMGGQTVVEEGAFIGAGAVIRDRLRIGVRSIVGCGAAVVCDIPDGTVAYGNPARIRRKR